ncbi:hypothetical protein SLH46_01220 [Draconibacterium sp. IB214405]|uniref:NUDIX hydrolase n=1 Tax=Draconibacterium sp. IB214405 TaxID=3097352 RepID=UPI002A11B633|nr:hypothetical protein [Draconibacterium sp. IB214405]MDX8337782.1 hypothetical protein [Draconibacterium sp. IB214405]
MQEKVTDILKNYFSDGMDALLPHVSINVVVFAYDDFKLKVYLKNISPLKSWLLPGGHVRKDENLEEAAYRNLSLFGLNNVFIRQIKSFGDVDRVADIVPADYNAELVTEEFAKWATQRFISVVYYGLVRHNEVEPVTSDFLGESKWMDVKDLEPLAMDHAEIILETKKLLINELLNHPVAFNLLPETFTLNELRGLYEAILDRSIDRGTFRRKMLKQGTVEKVDLRKDALGRPAHLYRFNKEVYFKSLDQEAKFGF